MILDELTAKHLPSLRRFVKSRVANGDDADDIVHDSLYAWLSSVEASLTPISNLSGWLCRVAQNLIINRGKRLREVSYDNQIGYDLMEFMTTDSSAPDEEMARTIFWEQLGQCLADMPEEQRMAFVLTEFDGLSTKEAAEALGVSVNTLLSRKHYAVKRLRHHLRPLYDDLMQ